jgi:hypothetical protein
LREESNNLAVHSVEIIEWTLVVEYRQFRNSSKF